jgi:hypothetical protein
MGWYFFLGGMFALLRFWAKAQVQPQPDPEAEFLAQKFTKLV